MHNLAADASQKERIKDLFARLLKLQGHGQKSGNQLPEPDR